MYGLCLDPDVKKSNLSLKWQENLKSLKFGRYDEVLYENIYTDMDTEVYWEEMKLCLRFTLIQQNETTEIK